VQLDPRPTRITDYFALAELLKKFISRILTIHGIIFEFEHLGEFKFIFENNLGQEPGDHVVALDIKKQMQKISFKGSSKKYE
jgi:hypothetical protein